MIDDELSPQQLEIIRLAGLPTKELEQKVIRLLWNHPAYRVETEEVEDEGGS